ncbi:hypothetical protein ACZ90_25045 [Streptomyces albus subsp. albus]|nr:hypothetical protein ACZ90_25045 [Streptomyces albus subsp. albus]
MRASTLICASVLTLCHWLTGFFLRNALRADPEGSLNTRARRFSDINSTAALVVCAVSSVLTLCFVKDRFLRGWWFAIPAVMVVAAVLRLTVLRPAPY